MTATVAVLDANVLYPALLRDLLLQLSFGGIFQARWSAEIEDEWRRNLLRARPELAAQICREPQIFSKLTIGSQTDRRPRRGRQRTIGGPTKPRCSSPAQALWEVGSQAAGADAAWH
jgi:PIN domain